MELSTRTSPNGPLAQSGLSSSPAGKGGASWDDAFSSFSARTGPQTAQARRSLLSPHPLQASPTLSVWGTCPWLGKAGCVAQGPL